ncbi:hypothetical protein LOD99_1727 [Oopsacas minuta]|uniref:RING-type E3 ubiquitin transferase n=1 Tax=Oopsacas minuta TaxID=111878 RepID=A0AAV7K430_9METZ|nr:hypothetical protein LOD99_1727 [Oopsacas minuta]
MQFTFNKACLGIMGLTACVVTKSFITHVQFYPAMLSIARSSPSAILVYLQAGIVAFWIGKLFKKIFFGTLQRNELENIVEQMWGAITDGFLAFAFFREITSHYLLLFVLLFFKFFHWTMQDRVESMERNLFISWLFHFRITSLIILFSIIDISFLKYAYDSLMLKGFSVQVIFGFEYLILLLLVVSITLKYIFHTIDLTSQQPWDNKTTFIMYTELTSSFIRLCLYLVLFAVMTQYVFIPLFAIWPTYIAFRSFRYYFTVILLARKAVSNLNKYQIPSADELERYNDLCIVCREDLVNRDCRKLPCGHIYHTSCLKSWFQRKQSCPLCRYDVLSDATQPVPPVRPNANAGVPAANNQPARETGVADAPAGEPDGEIKSKPQDTASTSSLPKFPWNIPDISSSQVPNFPSINEGSLPSLVNNQFPVPLKELSIEDLERLESEERAGIEARLLVLQNVRQLLDCATVQLSSYLDSVKKAQVKNDDI